MTYLSAGHLAMVNIPPEDMDNNPVKIFNGQTFRIARRVQPKKTAPPYYELVGAESRYGTPYGFLREWLMPIH